MKRLALGAVLVLVCAGAVWAGSPVRDAVQDMIWLSGLDWSASAANVVAAANARSGVERVTLYLEDSPVDVTGVTSPAALAERLEAAMNTVDVEGHPAVPVLAGEALERGLVNVDGLDKRVCGPAIRIVAEPVEIEGVLWTVTFGTHTSVGLAALRPDQAVTLYDAGIGEFVLCPVLTSVALEGNTDLAVARAPLLINRLKPAWPGFAPSVQLATAEHEEKWLVTGAASDGRAMSGAMTTDPPRCLLTVSNWARFRQLDEAYQKRADSPGTPDS